MDTFPAAPGRQVTLANWRTAPFNRWGINHMREVVPTAVVARDPERVWQLPTAIAEGLGQLTFTAGDGVERTVTIVTMSLRNRSLMLWQFARAEDA